MRDDFAVLIITHGRPDNQLTLKCLQELGYSGKLFLVVDDEDKTKDEYIEKYGADTVKVFHKDAWFDIGDNFYHMKNSSVFARNECFNIARDLGLKYFLEMDDDFTRISIRYDDSGILKEYRPKDIGEIFDYFLEYLEIEQITCLGFVTEGSMIGGINGEWKKGIIRKVRNTFFCKVDKPFEFKGRFEDISTPAWYNSIGEIFMSVTSAMITTLDKEKNHGGMAEMKNQNITYFERFYGVMWMPSAIKIRCLDSAGNHREHVSWDSVCPKIISERWKK